MKICNHCHEQTQEFEGVDMCINCGVVEGETHEEDPNFKVDVFKRKVQSHIDCGYNKEIAERKVLHDYHIYLDKNFKWKHKKRKTNKEGYFIKDNEAQLYNPLIDVINAVVKR